MEPPSFHPGRPRQETNQEKKERIRKQKLQKRKKQVYLPRKVTPTWCILPPHLTQGFEFWIAMLKGTSFVTKQKSLLEDIERAKLPLSNAFGFDSSLHDKIRDEYLVKAQHVMSFLYQNQKIRWIFKRFFTRLRIQRFQPLNEDDPITLEPIAQPIQFPSFRQRKLYVFEAKPFAKHLHNRLVHNDGHIPEPLLPKNPFTNEVLSLPQIISLIDQARKYSHSSWAVEGFLSCRYDLTSFVAIYSKPLRLHALRTTMSNVDDWDSIDTLYDFIKSQHELHAEVFRIEVYKWAVHHAPREDRIESWRKMCVKWYEVDILIEDPDTKQRMFRKIEEKTLSLCTKPVELVLLRQQKRKSRASADGSRGSRHANHTG